MKLLRITKKQKKIQQLLHFHDISTERTLGVRSTWLTCPIYCRPGGDFRDRKSNFAGQFSTQTLLTATHLFVCME